MDDTFYSSRPLREKKLPDFGFTSYPGVLGALRSWDPQRHPSDEWSRTLPCSTWWHWSLNPRTYRYGRRKDGGRGQSGVQRAQLVAIGLCC